MVLALWLPHEPGRPFVELSREELAAALAAVGLSHEQAHDAVDRLAAALDYKARRR